MAKEQQRANLNIFPQEVVDNLKAMCEAVSEVRDFARDARGFFTGEEKFITDVNLFGLRFTISTGLRKSSKK